jgi:8-oxo-dGTP pyrophosphatase MutT (NUDIX family)
MRRPEEVFILVRRGDEYLVLHRSPRQGSYWHCVAGALEAGESFAEAAVRELREETGLIAEPVDVDLEFVYSLAEEPERLADYEPGTEEIVVHSFLATAPPGWEPELDWEHDGYRWCRADEAAALLYWPEPAEVLREVAR